MTNLGYLSDFDSIVLVDDTTTQGGVNKKAISLVGNTDDVISRIRTLANGTKVNYDGTADSDTTPGKASQKLLVTSGGVALYNSLVAKIGYRGALTKKDWGISTAAICTAILLDVKILSGSSPIINYMRIQTDFELETDW